MGYDLDVGSSTILTSTRASGTLPPPVCGLFTSWDGGLSSCTVPALRAPPILSHQVLPFARSLRMRGGFHVIPTNAGIQCLREAGADLRWIPAFAGMTEEH